MREFFSDIIKNARETVEQNGGLITAFVAILILFSGYAVIENPDAIPLVIIAVLGLFFAIFVLVNFGAVAKGIGSAVVTVFLAAGAFQLSWPLDPTGTGSVLWFTSIMLTYFVSLGISYTRVRGRSRWGAVTVATIGSFVIGYLTLAGTLNLLTTAIVTFGSGLGLFLLLYYLGRKSRVRSSEMPQNIAFEDLSKAIFDSADSSEWYARAFVDEVKHQGHYLAWNERAYLLMPVRLASKFALSPSRRSETLSHQGRSITPWLVDQLYNRVPTWKTKGADIMLVLLDLNNINGDRPRVIKVGLPDTRKHALVGIMPSATLLTGAKKRLKFLDTLDVQFGGHLDELSEKQLHALVNLGSGRKDEAVYTELENADLSGEDEETMESTEPDDSAETPQSTDDEDNTTEDSK